jgi:hypothetical protein
MSKAQFIDRIRTMDPKSRVEAVEDSNAPEEVKQEARKDYREQVQAGFKGRSGSSAAVPTTSRPSARREDTQRDDEEGTAAVRQASTNDSNSLKLVDSSNREIPFHDVTSDLRSRRGNDGDETAAERRRRLALERAQEDEDSEDDGTDRVPPFRRTGTSNSTSNNDTGETAAERRRREGALGIREEDESDSESDEQPSTTFRNIRFADQPAQSSGVQTPEESQPRQRQSALKWGQNVGR